ncbi:MAG TPA: response regulator [Candidatus Sulfotelmatobacter sp.]|nr:response regulator [Candidatus Sulfotelmatobacter sp.]
MSLQEEPNSEIKEGTATHYPPVTTDASDLPYQLRDHVVPKNKAGLILMTRYRILLVDDDEEEICTTRKMLESKGCEVVPATNVVEALRQIAAHRFDVLITNLYLPNPGDGFAIVTAMGHFQPDVVTLVVSNYPDVNKAMAAIPLPADEVVVKPFDVEQLAALIDKGKRASMPLPKKAKEDVASILERDAEVLIQRWLSRVEQVRELASVPLQAKERSEYLPEIIKSITARLRAARPLEVADRASHSAVAHGQLRYRQGYTAPLIVQESRLLQVSIFETIERNLDRLDFTSLLPDVMIIADEADSQLTQSIGSFLTMQRAMAPAYSA